MLTPVPILDITHARNIQLGCLSAAMVSRGFSKDIGSFLQISSPSGMENGMEQGMYTVAANSSNNPSNWHCSIQVELEVFNEDTPRAVLWYNC